MSTTVVGTTQALVTPLLPTRPSMLLPRCLTSYSMSLCSAPSAEPQSSSALAATAVPYAPPRTNDTKLGPDYPNPMRCIFLRGGRVVWPERPSNLLARRGFWGGQVWNWIPHFRPHLATHR